MALCEMHIYSEALGMQTEAEVRYNCALFSGEELPVDAAAAIECQPRKLMIHDWCEGCGACRSMCASGAIFWNPSNGLAEVDQSKCITCGYCIPACPVRAMIMY